MNHIDKKNLLSTKREYGLLIASIVIACIISISLSIWTDILRVKKEFNQDTHKVHQDLKQYVSSIEPAMSSLIGFYHANDEHNTAEHASFTQQILSAYPFISSIVKIENVSFEKRDIFIQQMIDDGIVTFALKGFDSNAHAKKSIEHDHHMFISSIEPFNPVTVTALGYDLSTLENFVKAVHKSIDSTSTVATQPVSLPHTKQKVILILKPVYYGRYLPESVSERNRLLGGAISLIIKPDKFIENIQIDTSHLDISLFKLGGQTLIDKTDKVKPIIHILEDEIHEHGTLYTFTKNKSIQKFGQSFEFILRRNIGYESINFWKLVTVMLITCVIILLSAGLYRARKNSLLKEKESAVAILKEGERFTKIIDTAFDAIITTDYTGKIQSWNQNAEKIFGYKKDMVQDQILMSLILSSKSFRKHGQFFNDFFNVTPGLFHPQIELTGIDQYGKEFPMELSSSKSIIDNEPIFSFFVRNISQRKKDEEKIHQLAFFDQLTSLPNRQSFKLRTQKAIKTAINNNTMGALLYIDLDNFKRINDSLGHIMGDTIIKIIGKRILAHGKNYGYSNEGLDINVLKQDISRISGDEFTILITDIDSSNLVKKFTRIVQKSFEQPITVDNHDVYITPSIGIALFPNDSRQVDELLQYADIAKGYAKALGKNNFQFYAEKMNEKAAKSLKLEGKLRKALDNNEMQLYYQPQIESSSGKIVAAEALIRWNQPELGMIPPGDFIPLAEDTGMILQIGDWVIKEACRQNKQWQNNGYEPIQVAVNLSGLQFVQKDLAQKIQQTLNEFNLDARFLELEITESLIMRDVKETINTLQSLRSMDLSISVDDFGTGYSSLSYLKRFPLESLKIDRSFVKDIPNDIDDIKITSTIIAMAKSLNLEVVAEGVETVEQYSFLKERGCKLLQGFLFSKPVDAEKFEKLLINKKTWEISQL